MPALAAGNLALARNLDVTSPMSIWICSSVCQHIVQFQSSYLHSTVCVLKCMQCHCLHDMLSVSSGTKQLRLSNCTYLKLFVCCEAEQQQASVQPDPEIVSQLVGMGFSDNGSKRAAVATQVHPIKPATWLCCSLCLPYCHIYLYHCHLSCSAICMLWVH